MLMRAMKSWECDSNRFLPIFLIFSFLFAVFELLAIRFEIWGYKSEAHRRGGLITIRADKLEEFFLGLQQLYSHQSSQEGTVLGLSLCESIVEQMGSKIYQIRHLTEAYQLKKLKELLKKYLKQSRTLGCTIRTSRTANKA